MTYSNFVWQLSCKVGSLMKLYDLKAEGGGGESVDPYDTQRNSDLTKNHCSW
jgi:hypothetical protein